jgi:hypothetical protein
MRRRFYKDLPGPDITWKEHYSLSVVELARPRSGIATYHIRCHNLTCSPETVQVLSHSRAFRNKLFIVLVYSIYGSYWLFLSGGLLSHLGDTSLGSFVGFLLAIFTFAMAFAGLLLHAGLPWLLTSWGGTQFGVGFTRGFFCTASIDDRHSLWSLYSEPWLRTFPLPRKGRL